MKYIFKTLSYIFYFLFFLLFLMLYQIMIGVQKIEVDPIICNTRENILAYYEKQGEILGYFLIWPLTTIIFFLLGIYFSSLSKRYNKKKKDLLDYQNIEGPFILYLRSFVDDKKTRKRVSWLGTLSEEEAIVQSLSDIAPVYAIGDPRDKFMPIGAPRIYVDDEYWKEAVRVLSQKAVAVVLRLGETDSFWWEVNMVLDNNFLKEMLFIVPSTDSFKDVCTLYKILNEHGVNIENTDISIQKKDRGSISTFLFFDDNGVPQTSRVPSSRFTHLFLSYYDLMCNTLLPFRSKYGLTNKHTTIRKARILQVLFIAYLLLYSIGNLFIYLSILDSYN